MSRIIFPLLAVLILCNSVNAAFVSTFWPKKNFSDTTFGSSEYQKKVLIAGTTSSFRDSLAIALADSLSKDSVFVRITSIKKLKKEKVSDWNAIVIFNTCMAWDIENRAKKFLKANSGYKGFILYTTSGDPVTCCPPEKIPSGVDAISSASVAEKKPLVMGYIIEKIRALYSGSQSVPTAPVYNKPDGTTGATK
ncbi:MAG: hypothetical protein JNL74_07555 [Fibrobacteres bacterium]|nr:hypothetical protein [Fibrobacterota bacterium]